MEDISYREVSLYLYFALHKGKKESHKKYSDEMIKPTRFPFGVSFVGTHGRGTSALQSGWQTTLQSEK